MKYIALNQSKKYSFKLTVGLLLIFIITGNCVQLGNLNVSESPLSVYTEFSYYPNGQQEYAAEYLNGKLDGMSRHWSEDGILISESNYNHGKPHGIWKNYYANQNLRYEVHYFHGQKHGKEKWYHENAQVKSEQYFNYGVSDSLIVRWHPDGSIIY